jgi:hypothetical protein
VSEQVIYSEDQLSEFSAWLGLNYDALTWQGRYEVEFNNFWEAFFIAGQSLDQIIQRFQYALLHAQIGPLNSWFSWLQNSFISYTFVHKKLTVLQLSQAVGISYDSLGLILRDFFIEHYPELEESLSEKFQMANMISPNLSLTYDELDSLFDFDDRVTAHNTSSILNSMEVTLYPEWNALNKRMQKDLFHANFDFSRIKTNLSFSRQLKIFREILIFIIIGVGLVLLIQKTNRKWESSILEKISIYEPQLEWLDKTLSFKETEVNPKKDFELGEKELDEVESKESKLDSITFEDEVRYEEESDVTLTSWDALPKDFDVVNLEQSDYEEFGNRGYRDSRYGNTKVYRVLMRSVDSRKSKERLNILLEKYKVTRVDNVKPGKSVPGGIYYNLYVPREYLKEFMAQVMDFDDANLYESRTRTGRNPPGKNKVFIWIKNI